MEAYNVIKMTCDNVNNLKLHLQDIDKNLVGVHSLRAWGAMALKLHGYDDMTIMKMGLWTSLSFLQYIHNQISHLSKEISAKMSTSLPFVMLIPCFWGPTEGPHFGFWAPPSTSQDRTYDESRMMDRRLSDVL